MTPWYKEYSDFLAEYFDGKIQKLSVDAAFCCPNRDGTIGHGGCAYCNNLSFSPMSDKREHSVARQIELGKEFFARKYPMMKYLAYFQSYTSTHGELSHLLSLYREAAAQPDVVGLVIGTRPDCMPDALLAELAKIDTRIFLEFGAESSHDSTLAAINRGHTWARVCDAVQRTVKAGFPVGLHFILGLPGETEDMMLETVRRASALPISTIKFHQLQILQGTPLAAKYLKGELTDLPTFTPESYAALCARILPELRDDIAIDRFIASAPADLLIAPRWGLKNYQFTALLHKILQNKSANTQKMKAIKLALCVFLLAGLSSCGAKSTTEGSSEQNNQAAEVAVVTPDHTDLVKNVYNKFVFALDSNGTDKPEDYFTENALNKLQAAYEFDCEGGPCYAFYELRTREQDSNPDSDEESAVISVETVGDDWYVVNYTDMGWSGMTRLKIIDGKIDDYERCVADLGELAD